MKGLGIDIVAVERIQKACIENENFCQTLFTQEEQQYCQTYKNPFPHYAGKFAAKEAVAKALQCGFGKTLSWLDIQILSTGKTAPQVLLSPAAQEAFSFPQFLLSISHCKEYATAVAAWLS